MKKRLHLSTLDLTRTRFAFSPLFETAMGFGVMHDPSRHAIHLPWICEAREATEHLKLEFLEALVRVPKANYIPDFLTPPPVTPLPNFADELQALLTTNHDIVRREVERTWQDQTELPSTAKIFIDAPEFALERLTLELRQFWALTLEHHWTKIRATLESDVLTRARNLALGGAEALFENLNPLVRFENGVLELDKSFCQVDDGLDIDLAGRGLLLMPSAFVFPKFMTILDPPWQPVLAYTPRGVANLWTNEPPPVHRTLELLLGQGRSEVLLSLETPSSTLEIARRLALSSSNVSEHLGVLRQTGLVESYRRGRSVYYSLSRTGNALLELFNIEFCQSLEIQELAAVSGLGSDFSR
jgi:DNA-binding transcriptional ArsR family regulator